MEMYRASRSFRGDATVPGGYAVTTTKKGAFRGDISQTRNVKVCFILSVLTGCRCVQRVRRAPVDSRGAAVSRRDVDASTAIGFVTATTIVATTGTKIRQLAVRSLLHSALYGGRSQIKKRKRLIKQILMSMRQIFRPIYYLNISECARTQL